MRSNPRPDGPPRLLLVSYLFPPAGGIAVQRMLSVARYLPGAGFEVSVVSASNPSVPTMDPSLVAAVPPQVEVTRVWSPEVPYGVRQAMWRLAGRSSKATEAAPTQTASAPSRSSFLKDAARRLFSPDPEVVWVPFALRAARRIVRQQNIDIVLVSAPPFSSFLVGNALKREFPALRLVSDFRDEWLDFYLNTFDYYRSDAIRRKARRIEEETARASDLVLSITRSCVNRIRGRYPDLPESRFACVPNGFDPAAFENFRARPHEGPNLRVAHVGTVYATATPRYYLDALDALAPEHRDRIETHFIGRITDGERGTLQNRFSKIVERGFVPQPEAIKCMEEADLLLLTMTDPNFTSGKIYEYLATGKPILAISPRGGEVDDVLRETGAGWSVDPADPAALQTALREILALFDSGTLGSRSRRERVLRYSRPHLVEQLAGHLTALVGTPAAR